mgnify:CR=1 FL=1
MVEADGLEEENMSGWKSIIRKVGREESGQGLTEYVLILGLVGVILAAALGAFRDRLVAVYNRVTFIP